MFRDSIDGAILMTQDSTSLTSLLSYIYLLKKEIIPKLLNCCEIVLKIIVLKIITKNELRTISRSVKMRNRVNSCPIKYQRKIIQFSY